MRSFGRWALRIVAALALLALLALGAVYLASSACSHGPTRRKSGG